MTQIAAPATPRPWWDGVARTFSQFALWERISIGGIALFSLVIELYQITSLGYSNSYYAAAVKSMMQSWHNFFFVAYDPGGFVTIDKPPLGFWIQTIFAKIFGFNSFSLIAPQALATVLSVLVLWWLVRRVFGAVPAALAALALAVTPIVVVTGRSNDVDSMLALIVLLAAWAVTIAAERGQLRWLLVGAALVGLGFNTKMLEAYLVVPALAVLYLLAAPLTWRQRFGHLALAGGVLLAVSLAWVLAVDLTPATQRPFVGSSGTNSELNLALGYNGLQRLTGLLFGRKGGLAPAGGENAGFMAGENGTPGLWRLLDTQLGPQVSWLLGLAVVGLLATIWQMRVRRALPNANSEVPAWLGRVWADFRASRLTPRQGAFVLWGMWALTMGIFFSIAGFFHAYYLVMLAPALAALAGVGAVGLWRDYRTAGWRRWLLPIALGAAAVAQVAMLINFRSWNGWLAPTMLALDLIAAGVLALLHNERVQRALDAARARLPRDLGQWLAPGMRPRVQLAFASVGLAALLLSPMTWSLTSLDAAHTGMLPSAGPRAGNDFTASAGMARNPGRRAGGRGDFGGSSNRGTPGGFGDTNTADAKLVNFLLAHQGTDRFLVATLNSMSATPFILSTGLPVMALGGFLGADQILTQQELAGLIKKGEVRYFLLQGGFGALPTIQLDEIPPQYRELFESLRGLGGQGNPLGGLGNNAQLTQWVTANCAVVPQSQWSSTPSATGNGTPGATAGGPGGFGGGQQLYDCATPAKHA